MALTDLKKIMDTAKKAYKANKEDKSLKKAYKEAKKAYEAAQTQSSDEEKAPTPVKQKRKLEDAVDVVPAKKAKTEAVDVEALTTALSVAKAAYKADKSNADLKKAYKAAKKALEAAKEGDAVMETEEQTEEKNEEADDTLASLKKDKPNATPNMQDPAANEKCFVGNLSWDVDDNAAKEFFKDCGEIVDIFWLTNRDTGKFKGCGFLTFDSLENAAKAITKNGTEFMGRELKINYATPRPGGNKGGSKKSSRAPRELSARPDNCTTVFAGNLSFDIDDDAMRKFAEECGDIKNIRWLTDRESGDFKGCGFVEFYDSESVDNFVKKNGEDLMGRSVRLDYAAPRERKF